MKRTFQPFHHKAQAHARFSRPDEERGRPQGSLGAAREGPGPARTLIDRRAAAMLRGSRRYRLTGTGAFDTVFRTGRRREGEFLQMICVAAAREHGRIGIVIGKRPSACGSSRRASSDAPGLRAQRASRDRRLRSGCPLEERRAPDRVPLDRDRSGAATLPSPRPRHRHERDPARAAKPRLPVSVPADAGRRIAGLRRVVRTTPRKR